MKLQDFKSTLTQDSPPGEISSLVKALWLDARGDWSKAHDLAQEVNTKDGSWVHAYLHRKEGDKFNAQYWYNRADKKMPAYSIEQEWEEIVIELLKSGSIELP